MNEAPDTLTDGEKFIRDCLSTFEQRMDVLAESVKEVKSGQEQLKASTAEVVDAFNAAKGAFKVLGFISSAAKLLFPIVTLGGAVTVAAKAVTTSSHPWIKSIVELFK